MKRSGDERLPSVTAPVSDAPLDDRLDVDGQTAEFAVEGGATRPVNDASLSVRLGTVSPVLATDSDPSRACWTMPPPASARSRCRRRSLPPMTSRPADPNEATEEVFPSLSRAALEKCAAAASVASQARVKDTRAALMPRLPTRPAPGMRLTGFRSGRISSAWNLQNSRRGDRQGPFRRVKLPDADGKDHSATTGATKAALVIRNRSFRHRHRIYLGCRSPQNARQGQALQPWASARNLLEDRLRF
jgi:hypothetical protein